MKCSNCSCILVNSDLQFSCSHFLCNKCLSRKILLNKFKPLTSNESIELTCSCQGKKSIKFKECYDRINQADTEIKYSKFCKEHKNKTNIYCASCRLWLCEQCLSSFHNNLYKNHELSTENKTTLTKCFYHKEYNEIFCKDCNKYICKRCETDISNPENIHDNHATIRPEEYQQTIKNIKKNLRFKSYDQCVKFIDDKQEEITKDFNKQCEKSKKDIEDTIEKLQDIKKNYIAKYEQEKNNLEYIFLIIKRAYNNFYAELDQKTGKIDSSSYDFISKINHQISNIIYKPMNFKEFEEISSAVKKINTHKYYDIKFDFSKITYKKSNSIDLEEGISVLCPLECIQKSFACGTEKGKIKIYIKNSEDNEYTESGNWSMDDSPRTESITNLIELKKNENNENILLSGSSDKKLRLFLIKKNDNKYKIECKSEFPNDGLILDIFQLSDGRIAYSTSNEKIKIWNLNEKYNNNEMEISNKYVGFEKCLSEIQIFENDENNKQLVSGGREGYLKRWDINSGKMEKQEQLVKKELLTCITIINGHKLAIGTEFGNIIIFDYFSQKKVIFLYGFNCYINAMCYSNKSDNLFTCCKDMNIYIWNLISLKCSNAIEKPHSKNIYDIILCENDLISCSNDESINIYNIGNEEKDEQDNDKYDDFETN